jgi:hypothetical protein
MQRLTALRLLPQTELDDAAIAAATGLGADGVGALRQGAGAPGPRGS